MTIVGRIKCPKCSKSLGQGHQMHSHLKDAHGITGAAAHRISNPNDKQAENNGRWHKAGRRISPITRPAKDPDDDWDPIDENDQF